VATDAVRHGSWLQTLRANIARTGPFLREVQVELKKVSWPDRRQLIEATRTIIIVVLAIAFLIFSEGRVLPGRARAVHSVAVQVSTLVEGHRWYAIQTTGGTREQGALADSASHRVRCPAGRGSSDPPGARARRRK